MLKKFLLKVWDWIKNLFFNKSKKKRKRYFPDSSVDRKRSQSKESKEILEEESLDEEEDKGSKKGEKKSKKVGKEFKPGSGEKGEIAPEREIEKEENDTSYLGKKEDKSLEDQAFRAQLRSTMIDNRFDRRIKGRRQGKLDMSRLPKVVVKEENIFTKKIERKNKLYNIVVLVDESGSMDRAVRNSEGSLTSMIEEVSDVTLWLVENFEMTKININLCLIGFNNYTRIYKDFGEKITDIKKLRDSIIDQPSSSAGVYNRDYDALEEAYKKLKGKDGRNIVIFLSDGEPATPGIDRWKNDKGALHKLVRSNESVALTIGIGLYGFKSWQCPKNITANNKDELKKKLLNILRKEIKRG